VSPALRIRGGSVLGRAGDAAGDVTIVDGRVAAESPPGAEVLDAEGLLVAPGLLDVQVNGAVGVDLASEPERWPEVARFLVRTGVTAWCPTIITSPAATVERAQTALRNPEPDGAAAPLGLHLEGPMLAPDWRGAHPPEHLRAPAPEVYAGWSPAAGVALVTLAPELAGGLSAVAELAARGVVVSVGHTGARPTDVRAAADAGATSATHLFNAMGPLHHREVGTAGAVLSEPRLRCGLIADGVHVHADVLRLAWRLLGPERIVLVSDAVWALGAPPGEYRLGDTTVVADATSVHTTDGRLAGSRLGLDAGLRTLLAAGVPPTEAVAAATASPAALLGRDDRGHLRPGAVGDAVLLTPALEVAATVVGGRVVYRAGDD